MTGQLKTHPIENVLRARIAAEGPLTYASFIETLFYDETRGYYRAGKEEGKDYVTSPEIHPVFGRVIGRYIEAFCHASDIRSVTVLELGGASGTLARNIVSAFVDLSLEEYLIVERGRRDREGPIRWITALDELEGPRPFVFVIANEFFDALPFHKVAQIGGTLQELYVGYDRHFFEQPSTLSQPVNAFLRDYPICLDETQIVELTPYMATVAEAVSAFAGRGSFLVFDYGYHLSDIASGRFPGGSIVGYRGRVMKQEILARPGHGDVTHHVNFDHLTAALEKGGWKKEGEIEQFRFLFNIGIIEELITLPETERLKAKWLIHPEGLGSMLSVLGFSKTLKGSLPGFK
jgi:SAM-dependent MidA family methyltransferase